MRRDFCIKYTTMQKVVSLTVALALACVSVRADVRSCTFTDTKAGKTYNFTPLINPGGYYMFTQQVWSVNGYSLDSLVSDSQVNVTFYVQICRNILTPPTGCTDPGMAYSVTPDGKCMSWGDANAAVFDPNPYQDGANIKMYHGSAIDHLATNAGIVWFVCNEGVKNVRAEVPTFEHVKTAINQAHFKLYTHLAC